MAIVLYGRTVRNGWFLDDWKLFTDAVWTPGRYTPPELTLLSPWTTLHGLFIEDPSASRFVRPLTDTWYLALRGASGFAPAAVHAGNVALHALACLGLVGIGVRASRGVAEGRMLAAAAAVFLSAHAATAYVVPWASGAPDPLALLGVLAALTIVLEPVESPIRLAGYAAAVGAAVLSKETALPLVLAGPAVAAAGRRWRDAGRLLAAGLVPAGAYAAWWTGRITAPPESASGRWGEAALGALQALSAWAVLPGRSGYVGQFEPSDTLPAIGGALVLAATVALVASRSRIARAVGAAGLVWALLAAPAGMAALSGFTHARYVYLPLGASLAVLVGGLAAGGPRTGKVATIVFAVLATGSLPRTLRVVTAHASEAALWEEEASYGRDCLAQFQLARVRFAEHRDADGLAAWARGMDLLPAGREHGPWFEPSAKDLYDVAVKALDEGDATFALRLMEFRRASTRPMPEKGPAWCAIADASERVGRPADEVAEARGRCAPP